MTPSEVLLDVNVFLDYGQIPIEDLGTKEVSDGWSGDEKFIASSHMVYVPTMTADETDMAKRGVQVRFLHGSDRDGLGELIVDQPMIFDSQTLAFGEILVGEDWPHKVQLAGTGPFQVRLFTASNIPSEGLDWPIEGVAEINVLL